MAGDETINKNKIKGGLHEHRNVLPGPGDNIFHHRPIPAYAAYQALARTIETVRRVALMRASAGAVIPR
ncbi:hypothetical protein [Beijerinckia mobilis]|uniref:hypothetical protein n=1 Tax=Beijerinckia mobilis TaxID=231434 RepID=UPI0005573D52|nr:hypothetical protein [Beijerinckia mobilis]